MVATTRAAAAALPRTKFIELHAVLLQCMAETMGGGDYAAFVVTAGVYGRDL